MPADDGPGFRRPTELDPERSRETGFVLLLFFSLLYRYGSRGTSTAKTVKLSECAIFRLRYRSFIFEILLLKSRAACKLASNNCRVSDFAEERDLLAMLLFHRTTGDARVRLAH